jgi:hypothetical protein
MILKSGIDWANIESEGLLTMDLEISSFSAKLLIYEIDCLDKSYGSFFVL